MLASTYEKNIQMLQNMINTSKNCVFFGGAGVSTESGIPDFRSPDGLYSQKYAYPPEEIVSHSFYLHHKEEFYSFYKEKILFPEALPNPAHKKLAELEEAGKVSMVITQNIDGLHQKAGSKNVVELHGSVHRNTCLTCGKKYPLSFILESKSIPVCECSGDIKPDVVLYEEGLHFADMEKAIHGISHSDFLIIGGTSLCVYPAAGLLRYFKGSRLAIINKSKTAYQTGNHRKNPNLTRLFIPELIGKVFEDIIIR